MGTIDGKRVVKPTKENEIFLSFFFEVLPWLSNGLGGFELNAIESACNLDDIRDKHLRKALFDRATIMIKAYQEVNQKEKDKPVNGTAQNTVGGR